ncbi:UNKNOWN [Stylonychia lemnae]|uniref:Tc1-like transposase DDE domain-containing protein n=1 Tax=Stylonychia lemnae TaxID=5949 RepID=A0A078ANV8_STYLE|nr:UNKNOWN [Stylonychia lemnae]|eukprot:CDW82992.1 UNKNOWN [Stylonychia lemnae]
MKTLISEQEPFQEPEIIQDSKDIVKELRSRQDFADSCYSQDEVTSLAIQQVCPHHLRIFDREQNLALRVIILYSGQTIALRTSISSFCSSFLRADRCKFKIANGSRQTGKPESLRSKFSAITSTRNGRQIRYPRDSEFQYTKSRRCCRNKTPNRFNHLLLMRQGQMFQPVLYLVSYMKSSHYAFGRQATQLPITTTPSTSSGVKLQLLNNRHYSWINPRKPQIVGLAQRLIKVSMIAAGSSDGEVLFTMNQGNNTGDTFLLFLIKLAHYLNSQRPDWRLNTILLIDNAPYHRSRDMMAAYRKLKLPVMFLGPYQFHLAPIEQVFRFIKNRDLNPLTTRAQSRYIQFYSVISLQKAGNRIHEGASPSCKKARFYLALLSIPKCAYSSAK